MITKKDYSFRNVHIRIFPAPPLPTGLILRGEEEVEVFERVLS